MQAIGMQLTRLLVLKRLYFCLYLPLGAATEVDILKYNEMANGQNNK